MEETKEFAIENLIKGEVDVINAFEDWKKFIEKNEEDMYSKGSINQEEYRIVLRILGDSIRHLQSTYKSIFGATGSL